MALIRGTIGYLTASVNGHLTGCGLPALRSSYRPVLRDVLARIESRLEYTGQSATAASKRAGLSADAIRNIRRAVEKDDRQGISTTTLEALAPVLQTTAAWLLSGGDTYGGPPHVPIIGRVGADAEGLLLYADGQEPGEEAPIPPGGTPRARGVRVVGHSMSGFADDGSLLFFEDQRSRPTPDMLSQPCVVETEDGRVLVKRLLKGSGPDVFDLESINGPTLRDQRLRWAAHITAIIPPFQARLIIRHADDSQVA